MKERKVRHADGRRRAGFSYIYKKWIFDRGNRFIDRSLMEDDFFLSYARGRLGAKVLAVRDEEGLALKIVTGTGCTGMPWIERTGDVAVQKPAEEVGVVFGSLAHIKQYLVRG
jgi:hypothetical protein